MCLAGLADPHTPVTLESHICYILLVNELAFLFESLMVVQDEDDYYEMLDASGRESIKGTHLSFDSSIFLSLFVQ